MQKEKNAYQRLVKLLIILFVVLAALVFAYLLQNSYQKSLREREVARVVKENNALVEAHNEKVAAANAEYVRQMSGAQSADAPEPKQEGWDVLAVNHIPVAAETQVMTTRRDALMGGLMLLNRWHELPGDFSMVESELKSVGQETKFQVQVSGRSVSLFPEAIEALKNFVSYAKNDLGMEHFIVRQGYRTMQTQTDYWEKELKRHPNREGDGLIEAARKNVSYPGTSDYQSGFSFEMDVYSKQDSVINQADFQKTEQGELMNNEGWKFGFIFRYPTFNYPNAETVDKSYITGMSRSLKMDAYRYVGIPHATVMHIKNFCLEEYIDFLIANPHIQVYENGQLKYEIFRVPETGEDQTHNLPANYQKFSVSTDNMGGLIGAITY